MLFCIFQSRSLQVFAEEKLSKSINKGSMKILEGKLADICFGTEREIEKVSSEAFGTAVRLPLMSNVINISQASSSTMFQRDTHNEIEEFLCQKFQSATLSSEREKPIKTLTKAAKSNVKCEEEKEEIPMEFEETNLFIGERFTEIKHMKK